MATTQNTARPYKISKYLDNAQSFRVSVVNATAAVKEMQKIQKTYPIATMMVGRSMVATALMASQLKQGEMVSMYFRGNGPIEMAFAEANYEGGVRGYTPHPQLNLPLAADGSLNLKAAIGDGFLTVVRTNSANPVPYRGTVEIQTGEVGDDVAYYLEQSQQIRSVVSLGVKVNAFGQVLSAGGIIIELLPGANSLVETIIADRVREAGSLSETIEQGATNDDIVRMYLDGFKLEELEHDYEISYSCRCTLDRLKRSLDLLPMTDLDDIIKKKETIKAKCEFCGREYDLPYEEAQKLRDNKFRNSLN
jgi:molecular chaperone Hsp33